MMKVRCLVLSHTDDEDNPSGQPYQRLVTIPCDDNGTKTDLEILDLVFHYGQNDFSGGDPAYNTTYSLSVGDVILFRGAIHLIAPIGFIAITKATLEDLIITPRSDRALSLLLDNKNPTVGVNIQQGIVEYRRTQLAAAIDRYGELVETLEKVVNGLDQQTAELEKTLKELKLELEGQERPEPSLGEIA